MRQRSFSDWLRKHTPARMRPGLAAVHRFLDTRLSSDAGFVRRQHHQIHGKLPDLAHPRTFNEKIQWRKLHDRRPLYRVLSDKVAFRDYVAAQAGSEYLVPLLGVFDRPEEIPWDALPAPCVIKATHGCEWNIFVFDSVEADRTRLSHTLRRWLKTNHYYHAREWAYRKLPRRIVVERFLGTGRRTPDDFKFFCFDGVPRAIWVLQDRFGKPIEGWYDPEWGPLAVMGTPQAAHPRPPALAEMLSVASKLSAGLDFLRVDLYCLDGRVYCGELTVYPGGGLWPYTTEQEEWLGAFWTLPRRGR